MREDSLIAAVLRQDLLSFNRMAFTTIEPGTQYQTNWHQHAITYQLGRVARGECRRLIICVPPRSGKSIAVSVSFPAWVLGHHPEKKIMCISYGEELARELAMQFRTVVESSWYRRIFPSVGLERRQQRNREITTAAGGKRIAATMRGAFHGRGADLIIIDDPIKPLDALSEAKRREVNDLYDSAIYSRLNHKTEGSIVLVMQRLHEDDLVGHVLAKEDWEIVSIPAIETENREYCLGPHPRDVHVRYEGDVLHPEREPREALDVLRRTLGSLSFSAQYQQNPLPLEGNIIKHEWLRYYDTAPQAFDCVVASWDTASTEGENSDYSVGTIWGLSDATFYLLDVNRERLAVPELRRRIIETHHRYHVNATLIEAGDIGRAMAHDIHREGRFRPVLWAPRYDKQARLLAQSARFEAGDVLLPRDAPWRATYVAELLGFPHARHDDQVDSTSQALDYLWQRLRTVSPPARPNPPRPQGMPRPAPSRPDGRPRRTNSMLLRP
jgi:predicted phage terminase large subunit-like protein